VWGQGGMRYVLFRVAHPMLMAARRDGFKRRWMGIRDMVLREDGRE